MRRLPAPACGLRAALPPQNMPTEVEAADLSPAAPGHLLGFTTEIALATAAWTYSASRRTTTRLAAIFEAAFFDVPSIVASREPRPDTRIRRRFTGIAVAPARRPRSPRRSNGSPETLVTRSCQRGACIATANSTSTQSRRLLTSTARRADESVPATMRTRCATRAVRAHLRPARAWFRPPADAPRRTDLAAIDAGT